jgi:hypothetical protein
MRKPPNTIYKYRDWTDSYHKRMLSNNELYLTSPKNFNDPFDCRIGQNFSLLSKEESEKYITNLAISHFQEVVKQGNDFSVVLNDFERRFQDKEVFQAKADSTLFAIEDHCYGIFSCSRRWNSILMWSHYSANHTGICIGFRWEKMMTLIDKNIIGKCGDVSYATNFPKLKPIVAKLDIDVMKRAFIQTHTKAKDWKYEEEYRFMQNDPNGISESKRTIHISDDFFSEVIMGLAIPDKFRDEVLNICRKKGIPVYQAKKKKFKFDISREKVI